MSRRVQLVRLTGSSVALLIAIVFASEFSRMQLQAFTGLAGYGVAELPLICVYFARFSAFGLLLGPAVFGLGFVFLSRDPSPSVKAELVSTLALVFALAVVVGCLLAWQLPYYVPVVEID